ncbi:dihydrofolate reductase [Streptomyces sp. 3MP-14]|uniref:Dihydrofolate reductase n=1 Tax=Streptomyces mimosae TaxID=2586635 RepID=A0A5N6A5S1_9ACTN|nr:MULTISPECIES: dihydrofolate reductase family protein [Streptomyces]KAB8163725.1 dihydrofolate reductase [Streptomyces mimosae]KAB8175168.1 dihydrofolate reductase [Streptomyces sp. 3MP-14]
MKLTLTQFVSLDGVVQGPGGPNEDTSDGFTRGGWVVPYADEAMGRLVSGWFGSADAFLLGRRTYEIFAAHWPLISDPNDIVAVRLNGRPKYVASGRLKTPSWQGTSVLSGDVVTEVAALKERKGRELQMHGSGGLAQTLLREGLVDELRLLTFPVVLGGGRRLFPEGSPPRALRLTGTESTPTGVVVQVYEPAGELTTGSFELS